MGSKLLWLGLTLILAVTMVFPSALPVSIIGAVLMVIGVILLFLDK